MSCAYDDLEQKCVFLSFGGIEQGNKTWNKTKNKARNKTRKTQGQHAHWQSLDYENLREIADWKKTGKDWHREEKLIFDV